MGNVLSLPCRSAAVGLVLPIAARPVLGGPAPRSTLETSEVDDRLIGVNARGLLERILITRAGAVVLLSFIRLLLRA